MERVALETLEHTVEREFRFTGGAVVRFGTAGDRWFAWHSRKGAAWVFQFERSAAELADQWLARGKWAEVPTVMSMKSDDVPVLDVDLGSAVAYNHQPLG